MSLYLLKILLPDKKIYNDKVVSMTITGENGQLSILANHAPMTAMMAEGPIVIKTEQEIIEGIAGKGILKVGREESVVMVHSFKWLNDETDEDAAIEAEESDSLL